jgi:carbamoyltransferase
MAGGVALNCVANSKILKEGLFKNIWIQPASGDAGGALGAAQAFYYQELNNKRQILKNDSMKGSYLGPEYSDEEIESELKACGAVFKKLSKEQLVDIISSSLVDEKVVGFMQGRMEFGPRALGGRSIIADPRSKLMQKKLNLKIKYRESFRPFAPSILSEEVGEWFENKIYSPYMLIVDEILLSKRYTMTKEQNALFGIDKLNVSRSVIPAVTHVDYSARIQTVQKDTNPYFHALITKFKEKTGCPIVVNTSFNVRGEPIVCTPKDAFKCFMGTDMDALAIGNYFLVKSQQDERIKENYKDRYMLD